MIAKKNCLLGDITAHVEPTPILLINTKQVGFKKDSDYVKLKLHSNTASEISKTYEVKLELFENSEPEKFLLFICDFRKTLKSTGVM